MKKYLQIAFVLILVLLSCVARAQQSVDVKNADGFDAAIIKEHFLLHHPDGNGWEEFLSARLNDYNNRHSSGALKIQALTPTTNAACTNIDFEAGSLNGWNASTGYNPNYNVIGCCASPGGAQAITSGAGTDPCGGFPVVAPGGSFSLMLGNNGVNGVADRIEQTFTVASNNTFFSYRYAVVLEDPGHAVADQPSFQIEMLDSSGNQIPCAQYQVSAGQGIPGFQNSTTCPGVIYKPWSNVTIDLSGYLGQNVTIRFTTYDCALGGHFGYAYLDGACLQFQSNVNDTVCSNGTIQLFGIPGAGSWSWSGPGVNGATTQNVTINSPGNYSVSSISLTGCPLPTKFFNIVSSPAPVASFATGASVNCNPTVNFTNTSTYNGTMPSGNFWDFGDGTTSNMDNPTHTFPGSGTYNVQLITFSAFGCSDTFTAPITIQMAINASFNFVANCAGAGAQFTDNSAVPGGTITGWQWNFGDGGNSSAQNPTHIYGSAGTFNTTLIVTSNLGCTATISLPVTINPLPTVSFTSGNVCLGTNTNFNNTSTISSGTMNSFAWDFNGDGITDNTNQNPNHLFPAAGTNNVQLTVTSNSGCSASFTAPATVYPQPSAAFATANVCEGVSSAFINTSTIPAPGSISNTQWNFGDGTNSSATNVTHTYSNDGTFNVTITVTSSNGCIGTFNSPTTIYPAPTASFTAPGVCNNNATAFTNSSSVNTGSITGYAWDFTNDGTTDNTSANPNNTYPTDGIFNAKLTVTTNNGCSANVLQAVAVFPLPSVNFTSNTVCLGNPNNFINTSNVSSGSISSFAWDFNSDGVTDNTTQNPSWQFGTFGTMNVTLAATTNNGCSASFTNAAVVHPIPAANFTASNNCEGIASIFTNTSTIPSGSINTTQWSFGDASFSSLTNPSHLYAGDGTFNVSLQATSSFGCVGNYTSVITIYPAPVAAFTAPGVCKSNASVFTNASSVSSGSITGYAWDFTSNGTIDNTTSSPTNVYPNDGTYQAQLTVTTNNNCTASTTVLVSVYPLPVTNFVASASCLGNATAFTDISSVSSGSITSRKWDFNSDGFIDFTGLNPTHIYPNAGNQNPTLLTWTNHNCTNATQKTVYVNPIPQVNFTVNDPDGCPEHCVFFTNYSTVAGGTIAQYNWNFGDGSSHSSAVNPQHCYYSGNYSVNLTATSDSGCIGTLTLPNMINVFPEPAAGFSYNPSDPNELEPFITINDQSGGANTWEYDFGDNTTSTLQNPQHLYATENPTTFTITQIVSNSYGCYDTAVQVLEIKPAYTLYVPNAFTPNDDGKNDIFKAEGIGIKEFKMWIYDRWGNMIFYSDEMTRGWDGKVQGGHSDEVSQIDVFEWKVIAKDINDKSHSLLGSVTLVK